MSSPLWFVKLIIKTFPQIFTFAKLTHVPGLGRLVEYMLFENDDIMYLPKDQVIPVNMSLTPADEMMIPSQIVEHFIQEAHFHWMMDTCICRKASACTDYPVSLGCLFLGEAARGINPELGCRVSPLEAIEHVKKCREAGLVHLIGRNKLDSVWLNVRPGHKLLTICNCCPCCCLWRILPEVTSKIGNKITSMPGISVRVNDNCVGCGTCTEDICFTKAIRLDGERAVIGKNCRGCGRCAGVCPHNAIDVNIDNDQFINNSIERINRVVDVQ
jgi:ferredoxin